MLQLMWKMLWEIDYIFCLAINATDSFHFHMHLDFVVFHGLHRMYK